MAEVEDIVRGPSYNVNLAEVGKPEELPDIGAAMTQAFQRATNLVETSWFNRYQYQKAQYDLQDAAARLQAQDTNNKLLQQTYQQRADAIPLEQQKLQQSVDLGKIGLDQEKYNVAQRDQANADLAAFQTEINGLSADDPDYVNKLSSIVSKHTIAGSNPYTQGSYNTILNAKNAARQGSTIQQRNNLFTSRLIPLQDPGLQGGALIDPNVDVAREVANGNGPVLWQRAQEQEAIRRLKAVQDAATDPNDKVLAAQLLNEVQAKGPPGSSASHYGPDGTLDATMNGQIARLEGKYQMRNPFEGAKTEVTTKKYDASGNVIEERKTTGLPYQGEQIPPAPAGTKYNYDLDPDYQAATKAVEARGIDKRAANFNDQVILEYQKARQAAGKNPIPTQAEIDLQYYRTQNPQANNNVVAPNPLNPNPPGATNQGYTGRNAPVQQQRNQVQPTLVQPQPPRTIQRPTHVPGYQGRTSFVFPEEMAPEGSWQRAWNETVGQLATTEPGLSNEEIQQGIEEAEGRARFASTETGVPEWYRFENPSPSNPQSGGGSYTPPKGATAVAGINPAVWGMVMREEGPEFGPDGNHPSVFGLWGDKAGVEGQAYQVVRQYGAHSPEAYQAVTSAWVNGFLRQSQPWLLNSPGMQGLVISDSQHQGGAAAARIIEEMGGWQAVNQMDPKQAVAEYTRLRQGLWPGNQSRVRREESWALANS